MAWSFVAPSSRGIGFHLTRHLLQTTKIPVIATARKDVGGVKKSLLEELNVDAERLTVLEVDVTDEKTIKRAAEEAELMFPKDKYHLRLAYSIPGILHPEKSPSQIDLKEIRDTFAVNTIGPLLIMKHFWEFLPTKSTDISKQTPDTTGLPPHSVWLNMSARVGSTSDNSLGGWYSYRASKAGVTSISKSFDNYLRNKSGDNAIAIAYHPGTVKTGLSKGFWQSVQNDKLFAPEWAVDKMVGVANSVGVERRGRCWDWKGEEVLP
ncbi:hypothetical protein BJ878DRAFT_100743 [Calycina marina]|uniref:Short-chain dehydrogenase/reductase n=1 Tax=Calycina marina TaxID=1763456 RepID=A0A9P8CI84_9HELO|nr:hypothetical protein BJ878DRAFT_100743 [Calycina marina]